ncbi:hypothetical protein LSTR_LSTR001267 [Laodelphax striatellus]|uniref:PHD-type domain-containing protein n=1 Tax=Laodelphax striatellus TaxID=195883 RepID=A0A482XBL7_LAOST|nr:hypothetical protein LSTR_LSTR001267 [Laodelphax striatellus]
MVTKLEAFAAKQCCLVCKENHSDDLIYGAVYKRGQITVHYFCLLLSTDMVQRGRDKDGIFGFLPQDIQSAVKKSEKVSCAICHRGGATVKCSTCKDVFHLPCGIKNGSSHQFFDQFKSFCPKHCIQQKIPKDVLVGMQNLMCSICLENAELDSVIWAPCCKKNGVFHRRCLQRMAYSFGSYTLKCPLCNNREEFVEAVEYNGIFIPEQDASWEIVPNAFHELLERYQHCDAKICICPKGRSYTIKSCRSSTNWKILLCVDCGSQGVHYKCLEAGTCFKCNICKNVESASQEKNETLSSSLHTNTTQDVEVDDESLVELTIGDQNSLNHSNFAGSVNGNQKNSDITNTSNSNVEIRVQNSRHPSNTRSNVYVCINSNLAESSNGDDKHSENATNTTHLKVEMDGDENNQNSRNCSNTGTTTKVQICVEFNKNSNKSISDTRIQDSSISIAVEKQNCTADYISVDDKMDIDSENNSIYAYQFASGTKCHANSESIQKETSFACKRTPVDQNEEEMLVKRRRIERISTSESPPSTLINSEEIQPLGNHRTLLRTGGKSPGFHNQHIPHHHQLDVELEGFSCKKRMVVYADDHGKHLETKLKKTEKFNVSVKIFEGRAAKCLNYMENNMNIVDVSVILCGSEDVSKSETENYLSAVERIVARNRKSKFVIVDLPVRYLIFDYYRTVMNSMCAGIIMNRKVIVEKLVDHLPIIVFVPGFAYMHYAWANLGDTSTPEEAREKIQRIPPIMDQNEKLEILEISDVHFINELREFKKMISSLIGTSGNLNLFVTGGGYVQLGSSSSQLTKFSDQFNNPLIQLLINIMKNQDDFGLYVGVLVTSILENALEFERTKLLVNREELLNFLMESFSPICNSCRMKIPVNYDSVTDFMAVVQTVLTSKLTYRLGKKSIKELSTVIVKSFLYSLDDEHMTMERVLIKFVEGQETFKYYSGLLYQLVDYEDDWICDIVAKLTNSKVKILLFTTPLIFDEEDNASSQHDKQIRNAFRKRNIFQILEQAIASGVKIIACQKVVNSDVTLYLRRKCVIVIHRMGTELAKHVESAAHAFPISDLRQVVSENIDDLSGVIAGLDCIDSGDRRYLLMKNESNMGTLLLQAPPYLGTQLKVVVEQALKTLQNLSSSPFICPGAGCFEISLWMQIQELGRKRFKNIRWEWLLKALVDASGGRLPLWSDSVHNHAWKDEESSSCNCGLVSKDMATKLNANWTYLCSFDSRMESNNRNICDIETLKASSESVVDLFLAKCNAINISLETCSNICSIGSIVYRKRL